MARYQGIDNAPDPSSPSSAGMEPLGEMMWTEWVAWVCAEPMTRQAQHLVTGGTTGW